MGLLTRPSSMWYGRLSQPLLPWKLWGLLLEAPESPMAWSLGQTRPPLTASPGLDPTPSPPLRPHFSASSECLEDPDQAHAGDSLPSPLEHRGYCLSAFWGCRAPGPCAGPTTPYIGFHQHRCTWDLPSSSGGSLSGPPGPPSPSRLSVCLSGLGPLSLWITRSRDCAFTARGLVLTCMCRRLPERLSLVPIQWNSLHDLDVSPS